MRTFLTILSVFLFFDLGAQSFYNVNSAVSIEANTILSVKDSLVNNGTLTNNGNMIVGGVWLNLGTYNPGTGEITFNSPLGSDPQIINHNSQSFNKLTISGGGEKLILADMTIVGELILTDGIIGNENDSRVIFQHGSVISGGSDQSHINGPVYQQGTGDKLFPVGNGTQYVPVEILGITESSEVGINLVEFATPQSFDFNSELSDVSEKRYWEVDLVSGSLSGTQISLPVKGDEGLASNTTQYVVAQSPDSPIEFESLGQFEFTGNETNGRVVSNNAISANLVSVAILSEGIEVFNAISADGNTQNEFMRINNLKVPNKVSIYNRWGDKVFEMVDYDNDNNQKVFTGNSNVGGNNELPPGTYFYTIDKVDGSPVINGYLSLKK